MSFKLKPANSMKNTNKFNSTKIKNSKKNKREGKEPRTKVWSSLRRLKNHNINTSNNTQSKPLSLLSVDEIKEIQRNLLRLFYGDLNDNNEYMNSIIISMMYSLMLENARIKYEKKKERNLNEKENPNGYFLLTEDLGYWDTPETNRIWQTTRNEFKTAIKSIPDYNTVIPNITANIDEIIDRKSKKFNVLLNLDLVKRISNK